MPCTVRMYGQCSTVQQMALTSSVQLFTIHRNPLFALDILANECEIGACAMLHKRALRTLLMRNLTAKGKEKG